VLYAEWGYDEHFYAGYCYAECHHDGCILLSALCRFAEFDYAGCCAELHMRGISMLSVLTLGVVILSKFNQHYCFAECHYTRCQMLLY
jgi:hypothetical protein